MASTEVVIGAASIVWDLIFADSSPGPRRTTSGAAAAGAAAMVSACREEGGEKRASRGNQAGVRMVQQGETDSRACCPALASG